MQVSWPYKQTKQSFIYSMTMYKPVNVLWFSYLFLKCLVTHCSLQRYFALATGVARHWGWQLHFTFCHLCLQFTAKGISYCSMDESESWVTFFVCVNILKKKIICLSFGLFLLNMQIQVINAYNETFVYFENFHNIFGEIFFKA